MKLRYERSRMRKEKAGEENMTFEEFIAEEGRLTEVAIHEVGKNADFIIENNKTEPELIAQVDEVMTRILKN
jgi:hypothetical protein